MASREELMDLRNQQDIVGTLSGRPEPPRIPGITVADNGVAFPPPSSVTQVTEYIALVDGMPWANPPRLIAPPTFVAPAVSETRWDWDAEDGTVHSFYLWWVNGPMPGDATLQLGNVFSRIQSTLSDGPQLIGMVAFSPTDPYGYFYVNPIKDKSAPRGIMRLSRIGGLVLTSWSPFPAGFRAIGDENGPQEYREVPGNAPRTIYEPVLDVDESLELSMHPLLFLDHCEDVVMTDLEFFGNRDQRIAGLPAGVQISHLAGHNVDVRRSKRVLIERVASTHAPGIGFALSAQRSAGGGRVEMSGMCEDITVTDCIFHRNAYLGFSISYGHRIRFERCLFSYTDHVSTMAGLSLETVREDDDVYLQPAIWNIRVEDCDFVGNWRGIHMPGAGDSGYICINYCRFADWPVTPPHDDDLGEDGPAFACSLATGFTSTSTDCGMSLYTAAGARSGSGGTRAHAHISSHMKYVAITNCDVYNFSAEDRISEAVFALLQGGTGGGSGNCVLVQGCWFGHVDTQPGGNAGGGAGAWTFITGPNATSAGRVVSPIRVSRSNAWPGEDMYIDSNIWVVQPGDQLERDRVGSFVEIEREGVQASHVWIWYRDMFTGIGAEPYDLWVGACERPLGATRTLLRVALGLDPGIVSPYVVRSPGWVYWNQSSCPSGAFTDAGVPYLPEPIP